LKAFKLERKAENKVTLIASFSIDHQPVLIGDLVLSGPEWSGSSTVGIPTIGDSRNIFPEGSGFVISGITQKVNILSENLMIAWAGRAFVAKTLLKDLADQIPPEGLTFHGLQEFLDRFRESKEKNDIQLIGCITEGPAALSFTLGGERFNASSFGEVYLAGTGAADAKSILNSSELPIILDGSMTPTTDAITRALIVAGHLLQLELNTGSTLLQYYGGGYEVATLVGGRLQKIGDVTYLFWIVDATRDPMHLSNPYHAVRIEYRNDVLVLRTARIGPDLQFVDSAYLITPAFREISEDELLHDFQAPDMNSHFLVNVFWLKYSDGSTEWMCRVNYRSVVDKHINFRETGNGFDIQIEKSFLESIVQSIVKRLKKRR
jgi:hypothetical protein